MTRREMILTTLYIGAMIVAVVLIIVGRTVI